jgi:DNA-binding transcriptional LysR family regulator
MRAEKSIVLWSQRCQKTRSQMSPSGGPTMHARILRYLDEIVKAGSIRQAADHLNIASSAINRQLLDLEADLGTPLFQRLPRGLRLTAAGEILVGHVRQTLKDFDRARQLMLELEGLRAGNVIVAARSGLAQGLVASSALAFNRKYPRIKISVLSLPGEPLLEAVESGNAELGLAYNIPSYHEIQVIENWITHLGIVVSKRHPLAGRSHVRLSDCMDFPIVMADRSITIGRIMQIAFARAKLQLLPAFETNSVSVMKTLVQDGRALTFLSRLDIHQDGDTDLRYVPIKGTNIRVESLTLFHRIDGTLSAAASLFVEALREALRRSK